MSHSLGNWEVTYVKDNKPFQIIANESHEECYYIATIVSDNSTRDEDRSNAHLISAAPDLLEACMYLLSNAEAAGWSEFSLESARAAIKKATSKSLRSLEIPSQNQGE